MMMKRTTRSATHAPMSPDAYAGFLRLWITPASKLPPRSPEVDAYVSFVSAREPLSAESRRLLGRPSRNAA
jgi:hypothetical protein